VVLVIAGVTSPLHSFDRKWPKRGLSKGAGHIGIKSIEEMTFRLSVASQNVRLHRLYSVAGCDAAFKLRDEVKRQREANTVRP
jgi:hypothetical protein